MCDTIVVTFTLPLPVVEQKLNYQAADGNRCILLHLVISICISIIPLYFHLQVEIGLSFDEQHLP